jgi:anti-sigma B factor antagonist
MAISVECYPADVATVVEVSGRWNSEPAPAFESICRDSVAPNAKHVVLDLSALDSISSAGLSSILWAGKALDARGVRLVICGLAGRLRQIFGFSGLDAIFPIFESREAAIADCRQANV